MHDSDTYFNAWPRLMTRTIYVSGGRTTYDDIRGPGGTIYVVILAGVVRPDHLCTRTKYLVTGPAKKAIGLSKQGTQEVVNVRCSTCKMCQYKTLHLPMWSDHAMLP